MPKVSRPQESYDAELAEKGLRRYLQAEVNDDGLLTYRERIIKIADYAENKTPWWKRDRQRKKK